jgi:phosphohistidine phosphatase
MKVLLIRHTHAVDHQDGVDDHERWLTGKGRELARRVGDRLREDEISVDAIVSSALVRAIQTAELVGRGLKYRGLIEVVPALAPDGSVRRAALDIADRGALVAAIGHEPGISALAAHLVGRGVASFRKGQALLIDDGRVVYTLDPEGL